MGGVAAWEVDILTAADIPSLAVTRSEAFAEKRCWAMGESVADQEKLMRAAYEKMRDQEPSKMKHCAVVRDEGGGVVAACQVMMQGDSGDGLMPEWMRHKLLPGECYVEWIGTRENARGKGAGKKLMAWADEIAAQNGCTFMRLEVMAGNPAVRLYERGGYDVVTRGKNCFGRLGICCIVWCFMGCKYTEALEMRKPLNPKP
mmetsp:Transcript_30819/g.60298  ORF Transcript_30819/g.60298 Transcript_30819/m.60298 type:complete len:202 (+) Transcript_30819:91-696(+)